MPATRGISALGVGWTALCGGAFLAAGVSVSYLLIYLGAGCRNPSGGWGANRTSLCVGGLHAVLTGIHDIAVAVLIVIAIVGGLGVGLLLSLDRRRRSVRTGWLALSTALYATIVVGQATRSFMVGLSPFDLAVFDVPLAAAALAVWLAMTSLTLALQGRPRHLRPELPTFEAIP